MDSELIFQVYAALVELLCIKQRRYLYELQIGCMTVDESEVDYMKELVSKFADEFKEVIDIA